ncbi:hypothetical protein [Bradyrhizobium sp. 18]|uniref:hypothetical protein n=1 Tax=Bradyrhizobium sp. 18 TaxID=2782657 RepID=UPI001FFC1C6C|nr:hypothetical protein [Bradyrhizobium sp. 18]
MADKMKFKVLRRHDGDRMYEEGETREGTQADLGHLVPNVLELIGPAEPEPVAPEQKAEPAPQNKAEPAPANKAESAAVTNKTHHQRGKRK